MNLFDQFSDDYDKMVNWEKRLERERPFFSKIFQETGARRLLDLACGTGHHAVMLAGLGLDVTAMDISGPMVVKAQAAAKEVGVQVEAMEGGFLDFREKVTGKYDAVLILGNSLPHLLTKGEITKCLKDVAQVLNPGGKLIIQNRNYDKVMAERERFMPINSWSGPEGEELVFLRFMDWQDELINFKLVTLHKNHGQWSCQVGTNPLRPITSGELKSFLQEAGYNGVDWYGDYGFNSYNPTTSGDIIVVAGLQPE
ncbi:MAG: class I SAM-dependent DNA methyltransferase [Thermincolia bacterium]